MSSFQINEAAIEAFARDPNGALAIELNNQADRVVELAKRRLGIQHTGGAGAPAGGPPFRRSGELQDSVKKLPVEVGEDGLVINIVATAIYSVTLRGAGKFGDEKGGGYIFVSDEDLQTLK
jgi:hypothetical protein